MPPRRPSRPTPAPASRPVILSIRPKWAQLIASGEKTIEMRRTRCGCHPGTTVLIYTSFPVKRVTHRATVKAVHEMAPDALAARCAAAACETEAEVRDYVQGLQVGYGIELTGVSALAEPVALDGSGPQSWRYVWDDEPADAALLARCEAGI